MLNDFIIAISCQSTAKLVILNEKRPICYGYLINFMLVN